MKYPINKGVGKSKEVKGLRAQYVMYFIAGIGVAFGVFFLTNFIIGQIAAIILAAIIILISMTITFRLNAKFGENGITHLLAKRATPKRIANNKRIYRIIRKRI